MARRSGRDVRSEAIAIGARLVCEQGSNGMTLRDVAAEIGVTPSALHWHFRDREALLLAILETTLGGVQHPDATLDWQWRLRLLAHELVAVMPLASTVAGALGPRAGAAQHLTADLARQVADVFAEGGLDVDRDTCTELFLALVAGHGAPQPVLWTERTAEERRASLDRGLDVLLAGAQAAAEQERMLTAGHL